MHIVKLNITTFGASDIKIPLDLTFPFQIPLDLTFSGVDTVLIKNFNLTKKLEFPNFQLS